MLLVLLHGMLIMLITLLLNLYHLVSHTSKKKFFYDDCVEALISIPIVQPPDWNLPFEIMCDASDYAVGVVLG